MSELKAYYGDVYIPVYGSIADAKVYLKSEADKVIAEKDKAIDELKAKINKYIELLYGKTEYHSVLAMCAIYGCKDVREFHSTINAAIDRSNTQINHQKYKRCKAMARWCVKMMVFNSKYGTDKKWHLFKKWHKHWMDLAEKFKPNNSTAQ